MNEFPYRPNVCMILRNGEGKLFLGERYGEPGVWQFPQGGVESGATLEESVLRELAEELGLADHLVRIIGRLRFEHRYDFAIPPEYAVNRWRGQHQTFWLVEFLGNDTNINLSGAHPELMSFRWCSAEEIRKIADPKRLPAYERVLDELLTWSSKEL